jgi:uncharacterized delta-60 repeat protein
MRFALIAVALGMLLPAGASALGPGDLDESFGVDGVVFTRLGPLAAEGASAGGARALALLDDGRLIAAGSAPDHDGNRALALARYRRDGRLDLSFATGGTQVRQLGGSDAPLSAAAAMVLDRSGGAIVAGYATQPDGAQAVALARFESSGRLDWSATHQLGKGESPASSARDVALQPDGRIVVVGRASTGGPEGADPFVARFNPANGSLDTSFTGSGYVIDPADRTAPAPGCSFGGAEAGSVLVRADGLIIVGGTVARTCDGGAAPPAGLLRAYSPTGGRDPGFVSPDPRLAYFARLLPGPAGSILAAGALGRSPGLARYTAQGMPDATFAPPADAVAVPGYEAGAATALALDDDGRLVTAVDVPEGADQVVRLDGQGDRDGSFRAAGFPEAGLRSPRALVVDAGGGLVLAGDHPPLHGQDEQGFVLARLYGGSSSGRLTIGASARVRGGAAMLKLTCRGAPGCEGVVGGPQVGSVAYHLAANGRRKLAVPLAPGRRGRRSVSVRATNPPAPALQRTVSLKG